MSRRQMQLLGSLVARPSLAASHRPHGRHCSPAAPAPARARAPRGPAPAPRRRAPPRAAAVPPEVLGAAAFFAPGAAILLYALVKGKGNLSDGLSRLLTDVSQGYFQPDVGGKNIPVSQGELSDLAGDEPLFKALYKWWVARRVLGIWMDHSWLGRSKGDGAAAVQAPLQARGWIDLL